MSVAATLREKGLTVTAANGKVFVSPSSAVTEDVRATVRMHKAALLRELEGELSERRSAIAAAGESAKLAGWRDALVLGRLVVCGNCNAFQFGADPAGFGHCQRFDTEAAPFCPFPCEGFAASATPTAPTYMPNPDRARNLALEYTR